jgi:hypothetical protein
LPALSSDEIILERILQNFPESIKSRAALPESNIALALEVKEGLHTMRFL